jgi:hypothetical protein
MSRGGARVGAGRPKGSVTSPRRAAIIEAGRAAALEGETPLAYMLRVMRTSKCDKRRDAMAVAAAAYLHPKLAAIEHSADPDRPLVMQVVSGVPRDEGDVDDHDSGHAHTNH